MIKQTDDLKGLVEFARMIGADPLVVQGAGGNFSMKDGYFMYIKPSGFCFKDLSVNDLARIDYKAFRKAFIADAGEEKSPQAHEAFLSELLSKTANKGKRASMETPMHCFLPKFVLHVHPLIINAILCMENGEKLLCKIFNDINIKIIPYLSPGFYLGKGMTQKPDADIIFLMNHGMIICAETFQELKERYFVVSDRVFEYVSSNIVNLPHFDAIFSRTSDVDKSLFSRFLFPDAVIYSNALMCASQKYILAVIKKLAGEPRFLSVTDVKYLRDMEAEKYRQNMRLEAPKK